MFAFRRFLTVPALLLTAVLLVLLGPVLFVVAAVADLVTGPRRRRFLRLVALVLGLVLVEATGLLAALGLWMASGFGLLTRTEWIQRQNRRLEGWWIGSLLEVCRRTIALRLHVVGMEHLDTGNAVVIARHTSLGDALLPADLCANDAGLRLRYVLKRSLSWAPCIDIVGHRLPNHFVDRSPDDDSEVRALESLARGLDERSVAVIFPEGTFHTPERQARVVARLRDSRPEIAERADGLRHLLPPRPGGTFALLDGAPDADVVVIAHVGFERFSSIGRIVRSVPFSRPVEVELWRIPRAEIPSDPAARLDWLYDEWHRVDAWCDGRVER